MNDPNDRVPPANPLEAQYLDPKRFPLTTQGGKYGALDFKHQHMIDAVNEDGLREMEEEGDPRAFDDDAKARAAEFAEKAKLRAQMAQAQAAPSPPGPLPPA